MGQPTRDRGLAIAKRMKEHLMEAGIPVVNVYLFGSLSKGTLHRWSDVDIAVVYRPFLPDPFDERMKISSFREDFDVPIDIISIHEKLMSNKYSTIAQAVKKTGIAV